MTLRTVSRIGVAGSAMPFVQIAAWFLVGIVIGQPISQMTFHPDLFPLALGYLTPVAVLGFLIVLSRVSAGRSQPARLSDAAMAACVAVIVRLALNLRWSAVPGPISGMDLYSEAWLFKTAWVVTAVLEPAAWLAFLVTFVRCPAPPLAGATRRTDAWLALVLLLRAAWTVYRLAGPLLLFWWDFPPRGPRAYFAWDSVTSATLEALHGLLLFAFALAVWRMRPPVPPAGAAAV